MEIPDRLVRLQDLQQFLAEGSLENDLHQQAERTARMMKADNCSIMLLNSGEGQDLRMRIHARHGDVPDAALHASIGAGEGICGHVLSSGCALLVEDIGRSQFASLARRPDAAGRSLMSAPIRIGNKIIGVLNLSGTGFIASELPLLEVIALFIGKSIQVVQLQRVLESRFTQLALLQEARHQVGTQVHTAAYQHPEDVARILARAFFREMNKAGFESGQIVNAASELIDQLNHQIQAGLR
ncbi:GAF domain-containing protein [Massilia sp. BSC265]|uniref:GAF domain-containing protein n=1 Tax=Massilia sp. BSC265 TaxID=1549812 RepID=UPI0005601B61|nr:GAF domain-containing protein [Massilia sp. BSC265]